MEINLLAGSSPHIRRGVTTQGIMRDVIIALLPAALCSVIFFKVQAAMLILVTVVSCVAAEYAWCRLTKKENTLTDLSAVVTGLLLAFNLPPALPPWIAAIGGVFAIIIVKQLFGGLGHNFVNPALAARAFMVASWPVQMTSWQEPGWDAVSTATPLAVMKSGEAAGQLPELWDMFLGNTGGCIGETSVLALLIGAVYLLVKRVISPELPLVFIGTVGFMTWMLGGSEGLFTGDFVYHIFAGGLILGAFFMATDYTTSPVTFRGRIVMGIGCGLLTSIIRLYGGYPEGVSYSILLMNLVVPIIDRYMIPESFGGGAVKNA
ncbi:MAG: RnfABCDGE type electron transport complex subunit D [Acetivibrionales bacterium]|jgi:electron transport complex protein RnfD|nr:RnfABCDGE type electron transport complex subunit D [Bacillota bacterium]NLP07431.1 RnfABCDGE type electron transport complex subunit D [Clostridiaceae bacterium]HOA55102.1 RnfABCDGE type electron transport complex subunit D [Clostridiales bacterium]HPZ06345.1 RnfABCDGE type electron transport complex subunit D [Clostridiales bacterium]HQD31785.1 RnfABCDGE type electron transport complex subunit D [Clostridiales bacterium]